MGHNPRQHQTAQQRQPQPAAGLALAAGTSAGPGPSFLRVLNSEFIKFRTLLSTLILLLCAASAAMRQMGAGCAPWRLMACMVRNPTHRLNTAWVLIGGG